ncbi:MAG: MFS transporter [Thiotrichales bacterium]
MNPATPYYRLSSFYLFYFGSLGAFVPYWSVYLTDLGYAPAQIGELIAVTMVTKVFAPYLWGWIADHTGRRLGIIRLATFGAALAFAAVMWRQDYLWLMVVMIVFSFFWHAALPQFEACTFNHLGEHRARYSHIRLWGSVGFIVAVVGLGYWFESRPLADLPWIVTLLLGLIFVSTLWLRSAAEALHPDPAQSIARALRQPAVISLLLAGFLMQASHGPYYTFFSVYLEQHGYPRGSVGQFWAIGVIAEIGVFLVMHRLLPRFGAVRLFQLAILVTSVRWVLTATLVDSAPVLIFAQTLHAASYGLYHASAIDLINRYFPGKLQGRGQALYASLCFGVGHAVGSLGSGYLWTGLSPEGSYLVAAAIAALAVGVSLFGLSRATIPPQSS